MPKLPEDIMDALIKVEDEGCSCDLLMGWHCNIHPAVDELIAAIQNYLADIDPPLGE